MFTIVWEIDKGRISAIDVPSTWFAELHDEPSEPIEDYTDPLPDEPPTPDVPQRDESPKTEEVPE